MRVANWESQLKRRQNWAGFGQVPSAFLDIILSDPITGFESCCVEKALVVWVDNPNEWLLIETRRSIYLVEYFA